VHKAKGLEFPVVLCPYLWTQLPNRQGVPHADCGGQRVLDSSWVAGVDAFKHNRPLRDADAGERFAEARRLLYVALTRARHRCVVWWAPTQRKGGPLAELLAHAIGSAAAPTVPDELAPLVAAAEGALAVTSVPVGADLSRLGTAGVDPPRLSVAVADRPVDHTWRVWSFSTVKALAEQRAANATPPSPTSLTAPVVEAAVVGGDDEPADAGAPTRPGTGSARPVTRLADAPGGTAFGTLVHRVLEQVDFTSPDLGTELVEHCTEALRYRPLRITPDALARGLLDAVDAPLGGPAGALRLRDLDRADRLDELGFDLPLAHLRADRIGAVLTDHLAADDPLRPWAAALSGAGFDIDVAGMLTGSIDLVARSDLDGRPRVWLADYKSNQLGIGSAYDRGELADAMAHHQYALQAALYLVAVHRYLRWRVPGYSAETHLGGAAYLFLRGMDPARPAADARGVFWWRPPGAAVEALDDLIAGHEVER
jgi:exodeoxyribonuclease V beta subunit